jgi:hypothetical protein
MKFIDTPEAKVNTSECIEARVWDSEKRSSPFSTVDDPNSEICECCGVEAGKGDCEFCDECREEDAR